MIKIFSFFKKTAEKIGLTMAFVVNSLLLLVVYTIGVGLTSVVAKIVGKRFLEIRPSSEMSSYWNDVVPRKKSFGDHFKQF